jgi:hypothetical protein
LRLCSLASAYHRRGVFSEADRCKRAALARKSLRAYL